MSAAANAKASDLQKVVVVHRGARDAYQVAEAFAEAGRLEALFTDLYWPRDRRWAERVEALLPASFRAALGARHCPGLGSSLVRQTAVSGWLSFVLDKLRRTPSSWRQRATRWTDRTLGERAGACAADRNTLLLSYSYYACDSFRRYRRPGILFQLHPHPESVRRILAKELADHPECAASLTKEWELALSEEEFSKLTAEPRMAAHILAASSFTRRTLIENGTPEEAISVVPYGIDATRFRPDHEAMRRRPAGPLRLLFVGTITQRKGVKYLLQALRLLRTDQVQVTVCGRVIDDLALFRGCGSQVEVRPSVSFAELRRVYREADLFVFPSVAEGFAQVLLEAMASGLPILSTTHTAAPDLIHDGIHGWAVEPRQPELLAKQIEWALAHRMELREMGRAARLRAEEFSWARFRKGVLAAVDEFQQRERGRAQEASLYV